MAKSRKNIYKTIFNAALFIIMEIAALNMYRSSSRGQEFFLSKMSHSLTGTIWGGAKSISDYFFSMGALRRENEALSKENMALRALLGPLSAEEDSVVVRTVLSDSVRMDGYRFIWAEVVTSSRNSLHNYLIINKGSKDGVKPHSGVVTRNGVVGIIDTVGTDYSYALSLLNHGISLSARIGHEGAVGAMSWDGRSSSKALLSEIGLQFKFAPGDTVYTSGYSSILPPDIPLGIAGKSRIKGGAAYEIDVELIQDFSAIRFVAIVSNEQKDDILRLKNRKETGR